MRVATIILFVKDMARMRAFYEGALGLRVVEESDGWLALDGGGCRLALHAIPEAIARGIVVEEPPRAREDTAIKVAFHAADVAAERERLAGAGAQMGPVKTWGAVSLCDGVDPEGNVFQLASRA